jgi:CDGSH-type Zn-finger protein
MDTARGRKATIRLDGAAAGTCFTLRRCAAFARRPSCDGSHEKGGFTAP